MNKCKPVPLIFHRSRCDQQLTPCNTLCPLSSTAATQPHSHKPDLTSAHNSEAESVEGVHLLLVLAQQYRPQGMNEGRAEVRAINTLKYCALLLDHETLCHQRQKACGSLHSFKHDSDECAFCSFLNLSHTALSTHPLTPFKSQVSQIIPYSQPTWHTASQDALHTAFLWHLPLQHLAYISAAYAAAAHPCTPAFLTELLHAAVAKLRLFVSRQQQQAAAAAQQKGQRGMGVRGGLGVGRSGGKVGLCV